MNLKAFPFKILGNLKGDGWASVYESEAGLPLTSNKGRLFIIASSKFLGKSHERLTFGRCVFVDLYNEYYKNSSGNNLYELKNAVEKIYSRYKDKFLELELGAFSLTNNNILNVAVVGGAQAAIFRNKSLVKILVSSSSGVISASGNPRKDDIFILGTEAFFDCFTNSDFNSFLDETENYKDKSNLLNDKASSFFKSSKLAGILVYFEEQFLNFVNRINLEGKSTGFRVMDYDRKKASNLFANLEKFFLPLNKKESNLIRRKVYIRSAFKDLEGANTEKRKVTIAFFLIIFISFLVFSGSWLKSVSKKNAFYQFKINEISSKLDEANKIFALDPEKSRKVFFEAKSELSLLKSQKSRDERLSGLEQKTKELQENILKEYHSETELFLDLSLLSPDFEVSSLKADFDNILVLDFKGRRLVKVSFESKRSEIVAGYNDFSDFQDVGIYADSIFVLTSKALFNIKDNKKELFRNDFGDDANVNFYAGNAYVLDKNPSRIYRLYSTKEGFSLPVIWADEGKGVDLAKARSWFIDGFVWVLVFDNQIFKFSRGIPEKVFLKGVYPEVRFIDSIYSNEKLDFVYLLESSEGRIVVIDKNGNYVCQYVAEALKDSKFLVVSENKKKAIFSIPKGKLYSIELRHL